MASLFLVDLFRTPIESVFIIYLMYRQIGVATLIGVAFLLMFIPLQGEVFLIFFYLRVGRENKLTSYSTLNIYSVN